MSGMSGTQVYAAITAVRPELGSRFVFMSGDVLNPELQAFAGERGVLLLAKPFDVDTVNRTIRDVLARNGSSAGSHGRGGMRLSAVDCWVASKKENLSVAAILPALTSSCSGTLRTCSKVVQIH